MRLIELIEIIDKAYPDGCVKRCFDSENNYSTESLSDVGDTLALFISREIVDTFEPLSDSHRQLTAAITSLTMAIDELSNVRSELRRAVRNLEKRNDTDHKS